jgi:hypothetical protein
MSETKQKRFKIKTRYPCVLANALEVCENCEACVGRKHDMMTPQERAVELKRLKYFV